MTHYKSGGKRTTFAPERHCPSCDCLIDAQTYAQRGPAARPKSGDLTVCAYCRVVLIYTGRGYELRKITDNEWLALPVELRGYIRALRARLFEFQRRRQH